MSEDTVTIEVDGKPVTARKGQMLIQVTDANDVYVPRFCYHDKLSVAANCRMCLVEVEKAPKPLPACATPVMDGMKVHTRSKLAREAQKSVMEFLLINHPLDCPICDQGGECELQDLAMGYGRDISRFQEGKRVVRDKYIGPLVQTFMTRCIHCTRCVRFGEEIAGLPELGATGRGEWMEIGTYVEKAMTSELSGNVIDICPVGALTDKPFMYRARAWEMTQHPGIAPHDSVGSNIHFHARGDKLMRVAPADNEAVNEIWISDRDRYSFYGLYSEDRLLGPMVRDGDRWEEVDWETAFDVIDKRLKPILDRQGGLGGIIAPTATTEELYLFQKLLRGLGSSNVDHRLRQSDFSDQDAAPVFPWLGQPIAELERLDAVLVIGGDPRKEQPLLNHRLRKAALRGAKIMRLDAVDAPANLELAENLVVRPSELPRALAGILKALAESGTGGEIARRFPDVAVTDQHRRIALSLAGAERAAVLIGNTAMSLPAAAALRALAGELGSASNAAFGYLGESANSAGAWLAGAVPHRGPGGKAVSNPGLHLQAMLEAALPAYLLFNVELEADCAHAAQALEALRNAECVMSLGAFRGTAAEDYAHVMLPLALYGENEGTLINVEGRAQSFAPVVSPAGEARAGWKVLRVLGNRLGVDGFDYGALADVSRELEGYIAGITPDNRGAWQVPASLPAAATGTERVTVVPMNAVDPLVRRAPALQETTDIADGVLHVNRATAERLGIAGADSVHAAQDGGGLTLPLTLDETLADGVVLVHGGNGKLAGLGPWFGAITLQRA